MKTLFVFCFLLQWNGSVTDRSQENLDRFLANIDQRREQELSVLKVWCGVPLKEPNGEEEWTCSQHRMNHLGPASRWSKPCIACQFDLHRTIMGHNHNADLMADHKALFVTVLAKITLNMHVYEVLTVSEFLSSYVVLILLGSSTETTGNVASIDGRFEETWFWWNFGRRVLQPDFLFACFHLYSFVFICSAQSRRCLSCHFFDLSCKSAWSM